MTPKEGQQTPRRVRAFLAFALAAGFVVSSQPPEAPAQSAAASPANNAAWEQEPLGAHPPARRNAVMAPDVTGRVVLFSGASPLPTNDTWVLDRTEEGHGRWENLTPQQAANCGAEPSCVVSPPARSFAAMAYLAKAGKKQTVLFGGVLFDGLGNLLGEPGDELGDTWSWDGAKWEQVRFCDGPPTCEKPDPRPSPRGGHAMAYHPRSGKLVLFGGDSGGTGRADTWTFDGDIWEEVTPELVDSPCGGKPSCISPPARALMGLAQDATGNVVLFGGGGATGALDDTWTWTGTTWKHHEEVIERPAPRSGHEMAYYGPPGETGAPPGEAGLVVLFGSLGSLTDTWTWDGEAWEERRPDSSPPITTQNGMAYHAQSQRVVVLSGSAGSAGSGVVVDHRLGDTWTWPGKVLLPPVPPPPDPDISNNTTLELSTNSIYANGTDTLTATGVATFGGEPHDGRELQFYTGGDVTFDPKSCITGKDGRCSVTVIASITPGVEWIRIVPPNGSESGKKKLTEVKPEKPKPNGCLPYPREQKEQWWGALDMNFGCQGRGTMFERFGSEGVTEGAAFGKDMLVQPEDGKIVVLTNQEYAKSIGQGDSNSISQGERSFDSFLVRYLPNGERDPAFKVATVPGYGHSVGRQRNGQLVVLGDTLSRFKSDGSPDPDFLFTRTAGDDLGGISGDMIVQKDPDNADKIVATMGSQRTSSTNLTAGWNPLLKRFNADGTPDPGFNPCGTPPCGGSAPVSFSDTGQTSVYTLMTDLSGNIVAGGVVQHMGGYGTTEQRWGVARFLPNGQLDTTFNQCPAAGESCGGRMVVDFEGSAVEGLSALAEQEQPDGTRKMVAAGGVSPGRFALARFNADGTLDPDFNPCGTAPPPCGGKVETGDFPGWESRDQLGESAPPGGGGASAVAIQRDGRIIAGGGGPGGSASDFLLARYNPDGTLDDECGIPAKVRSRFLYDSYLSALAIQPDDGKVLALGGAFAYGPDGFKRADHGVVLARYMGNGPSLPPSEVTVVGSTVNEPRAGQRTDAPFEITLRLDAPACQPISFDYQTQDQSAKAGSDYTPTKGQVLFRPGEQERKVSVAVLPDQIQEDPETFALEVSNPVGLQDPTNPTKLRLPVKIAEGQAKILDEVPTAPNPQNAAPKLSISDTSAIEGNAPGSKATFLASLDKPAPEAVSFTYTPAPGTAVSPQDFTHTTNTAVIEKGKTQTTVPIDITADSTPEPTETFELLLSAPKGATLGRPKAQATIYDDDQGPAASGQAPPRPSVQTALPAGLAVPAANLPPPSLAQGTQIQASQQAQQQMQQQAQQQLQAQVMAGMMTERQRQAEVAKQGLSDKDAYLATARRQTAPAFAKAFAFITAMIGFGAAMAYSRTKAPEVARNRGRLPGNRKSS